MFSMLIALLLAAVAPRGCGDDDGKDRCTKQAQAEQRALYEAKSADELAKQKVSVLRAFFIDGYGNDVGMVSVTRAPAAEPRVEVRAPGKPADPAMMAPISGQAWDDLIAESDDFDRELAPEKPSAKGEVVICLHSWMATVELVDERGNIRRQTRSSCADGSTVKLGFRLAKAALAVLPACAAIDPKNTRNDVTRLLECRLLSGDRASAAVAWNSYLSGRLNDRTGAEFAPSLRNEFHWKAQVDWPGETLASGREAAAEVWARRSSKDRFFPARVFGESAERVRMEDESLIVDPSSEAKSRVDATIILQREYDRFVIKEFKTSGTPKPLGDRSP